MTKAFPDKLAKSSGAQAHGGRSLQALTRKSELEPGQPLGAKTRAVMEPRFGCDFSNVRVHSDTHAADSAAALRARAYTIGNDVVFGAGKYAPESAEGQTLLAHELTHIVQQAPHRHDAGTASLGAVDSGLEKEADAAAQSVLAGRSVNVSDAGQQIVQRQPKPEEPPVVYMPPMMIGLTTGSSERMQKIANDAWIRLHGVSRQFLDEWYMAMGKGLDRVPEPEDPEAAKFWWIALAGNLAWAATSLIAPEFKVAIRLLSFAGAAVGSGALQKTYGTTMPSAKGYLAAQLDKARDKMEGSKDEAVGDAAADVAANNVTYPEAQDQVLWKRMFPGAPYAQKFVTIVNNSIDEASSALKDFVVQYEDWRDTIRSIVDKERQKDNPFTGSDLGEHAARAGYFLRPMDDGEIARAAKQYPFNPKLKFAGL